MNLRSFTVRPLFLALLPGISVVVFIGFTFLARQWHISYTPPPLTEDFHFPLRVAPELDAVLTYHIRQLSLFLHDERVIARAEEQSMAHARLTKARINELDTAWRIEPDGSSFFDPFLHNAISDLLRHYQTIHPGFSEIFITDNRGLNIAQTNKTTDMYQADEVWWQKAYAQGEGSAYYGVVEFDKSSQSEAMSLYLPLHTGDGVVGIVKAVLRTDAIANAL